MSVINDFVSFLIDSRSIHVREENDGKGTHATRLNTVVSGRHLGTDLSTHYTRTLNPPPVKLSVWRVNPTGFRAETAGSPGVVPGGEARAWLSGGGGPILA